MIKLRIEKVLLQIIILDKLILKIQYNKEKNALNLRLGIMRFYTFFCTVL